MKENEIYKKIKTEYFEYILEFTDQEEFCYTELSLIDTSNERSCCLYHEKRTYKSRNAAINQMRKWQKKYEKQTGKKFFSVI